MAFSTTYAGLIADVLMWTDESESDELREMIDSMIMLAETRVQRELDLECFQSEFPAGTLTVGKREKARPATMIKASSVWITNTLGARDQMDKRTYDYCVLYAPIIATKDYPIMYAEKDNTNLYFVPTPDADYAVTIYGVLRETGLSDSNPTNWLSNYVGDLLLKATLLEAEQYLVATAPIAKWKLDYQTLLAAAKKEFGDLARDTYLAQGAARSA